MKIEMLRLTLQDYNQRKADLDLEYSENRRKMKNLLDKNNTIAHFLEQTQKKIDALEDAIEKSK